MLLHRVLEGELLMAVLARVVCVGLVAGGHMSVQLVLRLRTVRTLGAGEGTVAVA